MRAMQKKRKRSGIERQDCGMNLGGPASKHNEFQKQRTDERTLEKK